MQQYIKEIYMNKFWLSKRNCIKGTFIVQKLKEISNNVSIGFADYDENKK